jgi:hypothetical protein
VEVGEKRIQLVNATQLHLALAHLPIVGIGFAFLLLVFAIAKRSEKAMRVSLGVLSFVALIALPAYFTSDPAEEIIENLPWVTEPIINQHREAAAISLVVVEVLGVGALGGLFLFFRKNIPEWFVTTTLVFSLVGGGVLMWTESLGRQIRHKIPHRSLRNEQCKSCHRAETEFYRGDVKASLVRVKPAWKGPVTCTDCHDFALNQTVSQKCVECHTVSYLAFLTEWTIGFDEEVALIAEKLKRAKSALANAPREGLLVTRAERLMKEAQEALDLVKRGQGAHHPDASELLLVIARQKAQKAIEIAARR